MEIAIVKHKTSKQFLNYICLSRYIRNIYAMSNKHWELNNIICNDKWKIKKKKKNREKPKAYKTQSNYDFSLFLAPIVQCHLHSNRSHCSLVKKFKTLM